MGGKILFYALIGGMALAFTGIGFYCLYDFIHLQFYGKQAEGTVIGYNLSFSNSNPFTEAGKSDFLATGSYSSDLYYEVVEFKTETGKIVYYTSDAGSDTPEYNKGDKVLMYYNPDDPENAKMGNGGWVLSAVFIPVGLLLFFAVWKLPKLFGW